jgi:hypothetical protein
MRTAQDGPNIPPELELLLTGINDNSQRMAVVQAYYSLAEGDPNTWPVQFAVLIKAHTLAMNRFAQTGGSAAEPSVSTTLAPEFDLQSAAAKILETADTLTHLSADRIKWGLLLAWGFGLLSYPLIQLLWNTLSQIAHF